MDNTKARKFYNRFVVFYPLVDIFLKRHKHKLAATLNALPQGNLLEIGVGTGTHLSYYKKHTVTAIDVSDRMLKRAAKNMGNAHVQLQVMDGENLAFANAGFDYVVICHTIAVTNNPDKMIAEAHRVLKPGGVLYILNHNTPNNLLGAVDRSFNSIAKIFKFRSYFDVLSLHALSKFTSTGIANFGFYGYFKLYTFKK